jgi:hypothetical protein
MLKGMEINGTKLFGYVHGTEQQELHKIHQWIWERLETSLWGWCLNLKQDTKEGGVTKNDNGWNIMRWQRRMQSFCLVMW